MAGVEHVPAEALFESIAKQIAALPSSALDGVLALGVRDGHDVCWLTISPHRSPRSRISATLDCAVDATLLLPGAVARSILTTGRVGLVTAGLEAAGDRALLGRVFGALAAQAAQGVAR